MTLAYSRPQKRFIPNSDSIRSNLAHLDSLAQTSNLTGEVLRIKWETFGERLTRYNNTW